MSHVLNQLMLTFANKIAMEGGTSAKEQVLLHSVCTSFAVKLRETMNEKKERFIELLRSTGRQGIEEVINYLEKSGFFTAPASTKHHLSFEGGLMEHSMNVYDVGMALRGPIVAMKPGVGERLPEKSIIIAAGQHLQENTEMEQERPGPMGTI